MLKLLVVSLAVLCCARSSLAVCGSCRTSCNEGQCCEWDDPPIDMDPASLRDISRFPLGFTTAFLPRVESNDPFPCVQFSIPDKTKQNYIQVSVQSATTVCVYVEGDENNQECGTEVFFCDPNGYNGVDTVEFQFGCTSCPGADTPFFFRIDLQALDMVDEYWCDEANDTLPRDLIVNTAPPPDINQPDIFMGSAPSLLVSPALLVISMVIAALYV